MWGDELVHVPRTEGFWFPPWLLGLCHWVPLCFGSPAGVGQGFAPVLSGVFMGRRRQGPGSGPVYQVSVTRGPTIQLQPGRKHCTGRWNAQAPGWGRVYPGFVSPLPQCYVYNQCYTWSTACHPPCHKHRWIFVYFRLLIGTC